MQELVDRRLFDAATLVAKHPPRWSNANKQAVYEISCPTGCTHEGTLIYTRWRALELDLGRPLSPPASLKVEGRPGFFDYPPPAPGTVVWHLNFADPSLFCAYAGSLFAQDEMQVAEHPALGALAEVLSEEREAGLTQERDVATPILVAGVERRCAIATNPDAEAGRPEGLYGNRFRSASKAAVERATRPLVPPTLSNICAIAAPSYGRGRYRREEIERVLQTAGAGFGACLVEGRRLADPSVWIAIHSGFWGCGAFGGNRVLMTAAQLLAARAAGIDEFAFYWGTSDGEASFAEGAELAARIAGNLGDAVRLLDDAAFEWGQSDGN